MADSTLLGINQFTDRIGGGGGANSHFHDVAAAGGLHGVAGALGQSRGTVYIEKQIKKAKAS